MIRKRPLLSRPLRRIARADEGSALIEFAIIAPGLAMVLLGLFDLSYNIYTSAMLEGAIQKAARDSTLEQYNASQSSIDTRVTTAVRGVAPGAEVTFERKAYRTFSDVRQPEDFTDMNEDGVCNDGEPFEDVNGNAIWDADRGKDGVGSARDAVLYTVTVTYPRAFPAASMIGFEPTVTTSSTTVLRNQPFDDQEITVTVENCP